MARILHVSDVHCATERLVWVLEAESYDVVVASGDLECVDTAEALLDHAKAPVVAVTGNIDTAAVARRLREAGVLIDGKMAEAVGLSFAGVGGMDAVGSLRALLARVEPGKRVDVLVSHHPPRGVLDRTIFMVRAGLRELWEAIERLRPRAHLFGHIHEAAGHEVRDGILFVNAGPLSRGRYAMVDLDGLRVEEKRAK